MWMQINQAWLNLDAREQTLVKALAVFLVLVLLYLLIWSPIHNQKRQAQQTLTTAEQEWQWLNKQIPAAKALLAEGSSTNLQKVDTQNGLMSLLQSSLRQQNLFKDIKTLQGVDKGGKVSFEQVDATRLFKWLTLLERQGVVPKTLQVNWVAPGLVKADMQFKVN
ncbi:type II secretion system protein GspM [Thiomicrorhabdus sp.]|uniref:type II secretion system protein GspM n=1 Tax=Thiomicrorhabdus sp. TaxID=2039724 RepID=UPI002AA7A20A|nr:type II secretion system protein GspM [Thiomicrorhabdus sp.]